MESQDSSIQALLAGETSQIVNDSTPGYASFLVQGMDPLEQFISNCSMNSNTFNCTEACHVTFSWTGACYTLSLAGHVQSTNRAFQGLKLGILVDETEYSDASILPGIGHFHFALTQLIFLFTLTVCFI